MDLPMLRVSPLGLAGDVRDALIPKLKCGVHGMYGTSEVSAVMDIDFLKISEENGDGNMTREDILAGESKNHGKS